MDDIRSVIKKINKPEDTDAELQCTASESHLKQIECAGSEVEKPRATGNWWCQCSKCLRIQAKIECLCCHDWQFTIPLIHGMNVSGDETLCIADSQAHINIVLETSFRLSDINCKNL